MKGRNRNKSNPVAKNMEKFNRPSTEIDRKKESKRTCSWDQTVWVNYEETDELEDENIILKEDNARLQEALEEKI